MELDLEARPVSTTNIRSPPTAYIQPLNDDNGLRYRGTPTAESDEHSIERHVHVPRNITSNAVQSGNTLRIDPTASFYDNLRKGITHSGANHCIFICGSSGRIVPVPVKNRNNDVAIREQIREHRYKTTGQWKRYIPFYGVTKLSEAKFRFDGNYAGKYLANVQVPSETEIDNISKEIQHDIENNNLRVHALEDWETIDVCIPCGVDPTTGIYQHENSDCPTHWGDNAECPYQISDKLNDRYQRLCSRSLLTSCFHNPDLATGQQTFKGFVMEDDLIYYYRSIKPSSQYNARIGGTEFVTLHIQEGFLFSFKPDPLLSTIFAVMAIFIWGLFTMDWKSTSQMILTVITTVISNMITGQPGK